MCTYTGCASHYYLLHGAVLGTGALLPENVSGVCELAVCKLRASIMLSSYAGTRNALDLADVGLAVSYFCIAVRLPIGREDAVRSSQNYFLGFGPFTIVRGYPKLSPATVSCRTL